MTRRLYTSELGCIAADELSDLGAGKEGWLVDSPGLVVALDTHALAFANRSSILILNWSVSIDGRPNPDMRHAVKIVPELSPMGNEFVSAIEWFVLDDETRVLVVGTSLGYLMIFSGHGSLLHRQFVNPGKIIKLRVQQNTAQGALSQGVSIIMPGAIARFSGSEIQNVLQRRIQATNSLFWDREFHEKDSGNVSSVLPYELWNINKYGSCVDAAITGVMPPPLMETQSSQRYYCAVSIGDDAVISAYRLSVDNSRSLVGAILSKVVPATFSTIASFSKFIWPSDSSRTKKPEPTSQPARVFPLTCLKDHPRKGEKLTLSPSGTLAAVTDSLGRILLLDTQAFVVVRLWKGYREASCLFVEMLATKEKSLAHPQECTKSDYCLCLAIHAPRKGIVEVWKMRTGPRLATIQCPKGCRMLQPTYRHISELQSSAYVPLQVFILNGDSGELSVLNPSVH